MVSVPSPLGFCLRCISRSERSAATTLFEGAALCDSCALVALGLEAHSRSAKLQALAEVDAQSG